MSQRLLISNPPHERVDAQVAASVLGIPAVDANLKARYSVPEIWLADEHGEAIDTAAATLAKAGTRAVAADGADLAGVPKQRLVRGFSFTDQGFQLQLRDNNGGISYERAALFVTCTPRAAEGAAPGTRVVEERQLSDSSAFLDVYVSGKERWGRVGIYGEVIDFAGLGEQRTPSQARNLTQLVQLLRSRMTNAVFDDRLVNMQLRRRPGPGTPPQLQEMRRGYSYATPGLATLLESISPDLRDISQTELSSRLAFLTHLNTR